jgi:tetratricopeptide (TPR) repeat protein
VKAAEYFQAATETDPDYALAWAGLAEVYHLRAYDYAGRESRSELHQQAVRAVERALELDDELAEAHVSRGILLAYHPPYDDDAAETELRRAIELDPRLSNAHRELGLVLMRKRGRVQDALDELIAAERLEPYWGPLKVQVIEAHLENGDLENAVKTADQGQVLGLRPSLGALVSSRSRAALQDFQGAERYADTIAQSHRWGYGPR